MARISKIVAPLFFSAVGPSSPTCSALRVVMKEQRESAAGSDKDKVDKVDSTESDEATCQLKNEVKVTVTSKDFPPATPWTPLEKEFGIVVFTQYHDLIAHDGSYTDWVTKMSKRKDFSEVSSDQTSAVVRESRIVSNQTSMDPAQDRKEASIDSDSNGNEEQRQATVWIPGTVKFMEEDKLNIRENDPTLKNAKIGMPVKLMGVKMEECGNDEIAKTYVYTFIFYPARENNGEDYFWSWLVGIFLGFYNTCNVFYYWPRYTIVGQLDDQRLLADDYWSPSLPELFGIGTLGILSVGVCVCVIRNLCIIENTGICRTRNRRHSDAHDCEWNFLFCYTLWMSSGKCKCVLLPVGSRCLVFAFVLGTFIGVLSMVLIVCNRL